MDTRKAKTLEFFRSVAPLRAISIIFVYLIFIFLWVKGYTKNIDLFFYSPIYLTIFFALALALTFIYRHIYRIIPRLEFLIYFYLFMDTIAIGVILYLTGGVLSFLFPLYFLVIIVTSFMCARSISYFSSIIATITYCFLFFMESYFQVHPVTGFLEISQEKTPLIFGFNIILLLLFGFFSDSIANFLQRKNKELSDSNLKLQKVQKEAEENMKKLSFEKEKLEATYREMEENAKALEKSDGELTKANRLLDDRVKGHYTLHEIGTLLSSAKTLKGILKAINESIVGLLEYECSLMVLIRSVESDFFIHRGLGFSLKTLNKFEEVIQSGALPYSVVKGEALIVNNQAIIPEEFQPYVKALGVRHFIEVPLKVKGEVIGAIIAGKDNTYEDEKLEENDCELLSILAAHAAASIENARTTEAIIEAKNQIEAIINSIIDGIVVTDSEEKVLLVNPAFERIFRLSFEEMRGKDLEDFIDNESFLDLLEKEIPFDKDFISNEIEITTLLETAPRTFKASISRVRNDKGEELGKVTLFRDITYEKEVDRMKSEFISTVSHELRTPLTSIKSFTEILLTYDEDKETQKEFLTIINEESERLTRLINDVLDISKIESGRVEWKLEEMNIEELIVSAINSTSSLMHKKSLNVELDIDEGLPKVEADRDKIIQVITNLISNAIKFSPEKEDIVLKAYRKDGHVSVSVKDNGRGIARHNQEKIFLKFCQIEDEVEGKPDGTGLGLAICKEIIKYHRGNIWVESETGKGSNFIFSLPVKGEGSKGKDGAPKVIAKGTKLIRLAKKTSKLNLKDVQGKK